MFDDANPPSEPDSPARLDSGPAPGPAEVRFRSCRWHVTEGAQKYCSHRDVLPYAGKSGFDAAAWCPDCTLYKVRRTPKKRVPDDGGPLH